MRRSAHTCWQLKMQWSTRRSYCWFFTFCFFFISLQETWGKNKLDFVQLLNWFLHVPNPAASEWLCSSLLYLAAFMMPLSQSCSSKTASAKMQQHYQLQNWFLQNKGWHYYQLPLPCTHNLSFWSTKHCLSGAPPQVLPWIFRSSLLTRVRSSSGEAPSPGCKNPTFLSRSPRCPSWNPRRTTAHGSVKWNTAATCIHSVCPFSSLFNRLSLFAEKMCPFHNKFSVWASYFMFSFQF